MPGRILIDRSYIHGRETLALRRCVSLNSASTAITNSYIAECHEKGPDSQAISGWNGPGPYRIENNYLEAGHEVITLGGSDPSIPGLIPSDIEIRRNHITRPMGWQGRWDIKNLIEFKAGQRILIQGNVIENNWADLQVGFALLFWSNNQDGNAPWTATQDITVRDNVIRNTAQAINITAKAANPSIPARRISIANNLIYKLGAASLGGGGRGFQLVGPVSDIYVVGNTVFSPTLAVVMDGGQQPGFQLRNNVFGPSEYAIFGADVADGQPALTRYAPGAQVSGNVFVGTSPRIYPTGNAFPATVGEVGLSALAAGEYTLGQVLAQTPGVGGQPAGVDYGTLVAQTAGAVR